MNNSLHLITRASLRNNKFLSVLFCLFVVISTVFIVAIAGILLHMKNNIDTVLKQHVTLRQIVVEFDKGTTDDYIEDIVKKIKKVDHITDAYEPIGVVGVQDGDILKDSYQMDRVPVGGDLRITSGRMIDENESGVALVPDHINDLDTKENRINDIDGNKLVGKTLKFVDDANKTRKMKVVGAFSTFDPTIDNKTLFIPFADLSKYKSEVDKMFVADGASPNGKRSFILIVDRAENVETVADYITDNYIYSYVNYSSLNPNEYDTAILMLMLSLVLLVALSVVGFYVFLKNNIDRRTSELALYRSLGYKSKHLFRIIFSEHLIFALASFVLGVVVVAVLYAFVVNPFLDSLLGGTLMEISLSVDPVVTVLVLAVLILMMYLVCKRAVKRSEKIDLTVLLKNL